MKFIWTQGRGQNSGLEAPCGSSGSATWPMFDEDGVIFQQRALIKFLFLIGKIDKPFTVSYVMRLMML